MVACLQYLTGLERRTVVENLGKIRDTNKPPHRLRLGGLFRGVISVVIPFEEGNGDKVNGLDCLCFQSTQFLTL